MDFEKCINCNVLTDYADERDEGDNSIYVTLNCSIFKNNGDEYGPLCDDCYDYLESLGWIDD